jgi:hypothetical protein
MKRAALILFLIATTALAHSPLAGGSFTLDRARSDDVTRAIESVVTKMHVVTRGIARRRLRQTNPPYESISLTFTGDAARITAGPGGPLVLPLSGAPVRWKRDGETLTVTGVMRGDTYVETLSAPDGRRTNAFTRTSDGGLQLDVTVTSSRLPAPLRYQLVYRKR